MSHPLTTEAPPDQPVPVRARPATTARSRSREHSLAWLLLLPSLVVFALFVFWPLGRTLYLSTHGNDIFGAPTAYVGFDHYADMLSAEFGKILTTTALFTAMSVLPAVLGALVVVLLLEARIRGVRVLRTAFALPFAFSVATASVVFWLSSSPASRPR